MGDVEDALATPTATMTARGQWRIEQPLAGVPQDAAVVGIAKRAQQRTQPHDQSNSAAQYCLGGARRDFDEAGVSQSLARQGFFGVQPAAPSVTGAGGAELRQNPPDPAMVAILEPGEITGHVGAGPRRVAGLCGDGVPVSG